MSQEEENREHVRNGFRAFNERGPDGLIEFVTEDFEMTTPASLASEPDVYRGKEGFRRYWDSFYEAMDRITVDASEMWPVGENQVIVKADLVARGRSSGIETNLLSFHLWTVRGAKASHVTFFATLEEAQAAAA